MKKLYIIFLVAIGTLFLVAACTSSGKTEAGRKSFIEYCSVCHPDGGNIIKPDKTLRKDALRDHGISTAEDIVAKIRNPGPGMTRFDKATIPDNTAKEIAEYILKTF